MPVFERSSPGCQGGLSTTTEMLDMEQLSNSVVVFGTAPLLTFGYYYSSCIKLIKSRSFLNFKNFNLSKYSCVSVSFSIRKYLLKN